MAIVFGLAVVLAVVAVLIWGAFQPTETSLSEERKARKREENSSQSSGTTQPNGVDQE